MLAASIVTGISVGQVTSALFSKHEFLIRRLHSLAGLIPVGAYMCVHLATNASILNGPETFQNNVYTIHSLGNLLPLVEWAFIFLPIIFHAVIGVWIIMGGSTNTAQYRYGSNWRYVMQRITGMIAFLFIFWHVFHLHGWFHSPWWLANVAEPLGGANFRAYNASSTLREAMTGFVVPTLYAIGVLSCVFHLANGIWTMGITWGAWTTPAAQDRALKVCSGLGVVLAIVGMSALWGAKNVGKPENVEAVRQVEDRMYDARVEAGSVIPNEHKRTSNPDNSQIIAEETEEVAKRDPPSPGTGEGPGEGAEAR